MGLVIMVIMSMMERKTFVGQGARLEVEAMEGRISMISRISAGLEATSERITPVIVVAQ